MKARCDQNEAPLPEVKGYSSFLHMQTPSTCSPHHAGIYGMTKKQKGAWAYHQYPHYSHAAKSKSKGQSSKIDCQRHPPPRYGPVEIRTCQTLSGHPTSGDHENSSKSQQDQPASAGQHHPHQRHNQQLNKTDLNLKRQNPNAGLKPYVPKRSCTHKKKTSSDNQNESTGRISDMFIVDPFIASQQESPTAGNRPPRHLFCTFDLHEGPVTRVQWNVPQFSHLLLSSSMDKTVRLWDYSTQMRCVQTLRCHDGAVKDAQWSGDGRQILSCGFDKTARLTDAESGTNYQVFDHTSYVTCIKWHPADPQLFLSGSYGSTLYSWDTRTGQIAHKYCGKLGQILALEFINNGSEFVATCDTVSRDSTDRTVMVWDTDTAALLSNQLYHEKYTCPSLKVHPTDSVFMAQSNANYIAMFSTKRPYRLNKYQRFEGHEVEGYQIGCDFSPDGSLVVSGSSDGKMYLYNYETTAFIKTLGDGGKDGACLDVAWHPIIPSVVASCSWQGRVNVWR